MTLSDFGELLNQLEGSCRIGVYHYHAEQDDYPYLVYHEYGEENLRADNRIVASFDYVQVSYFTKKSTDGAVKAIRNLLNENEILFDYKVLREYDETGKGGNVPDVYHHVFDCELL